MKFDALLFDFDGVLIDSEAVGNRHIAEWLTAAGHPTSAELFPREGGDPGWAPAFAGEQGGRRPQGSDQMLPINRATSSKLSASASTPIASSRAPCSALQCDPADKPMT